MLKPTIDLSRVPVEYRDEAESLLAALDEAVSENPLELFAPHSPAQASFLEARTRIVAAFAGNRFGKTTAGVVKTLAQALPDFWLPEHLKPYKQVQAPSHGWILVPTEDKVFDSLLPAFRKWTPQKALHRQNFAKAFNGERMELRFECGSTIAFKTYRMDVSTLGGADLDYVMFDEPPPKAHYNECIARMARGVRAWFAMTPLRVNVAWIRREIWRERESPDITVVTGSIRDNPTLAEAEVDFILDSYSDTERRARETGEFMDVFGLVYARFPTAEAPPPTREFVKSLEKVGAIDPGIRNAAILMGGFDHHGVGWIFDEHLVVDGTPSEYLEVIDAMCTRWGLERDQLLWVIDPAARQRSQATGDTVQSELGRLGLPTISGVRDRELGQQQIRDRLKHGRLKVSTACVGLRDEADEFAYPLAASDDLEEDKGAADDSPYHRLATLRYLVTLRPFHPHLEALAPGRDLGAAIRTGRVPPVARWNVSRPPGPLDRFA